MPMPPQEIPAGQSKRISKISSREAAAQAAVAQEQGARERAAQLPALAAAGRPALAAAKRRALEGTAAQPATIRAADAELSAGRPAIRSAGYRWVSALSALF